jgi:hypothetical protein
MNNENTSKLILFLDPIGRNILGEVVDNKPETNLFVKNPVILHVADSGGGKMSVQLLPLFFREFLADKTSDVTFSYQKDKITITDIDAFDFRLQAQYNQIFSKQSVFVTPEQQTQQQPQQPSNSVINLFDE